jgi:hypothetical protein
MLEKLKLAVLSEKRVLFFNVAMRLIAINLLLSPVSFQQSHIAAQFDAPDFDKSCLFQPALHLFQAVGISPVCIHQHIYGK